MNEDKFSIPRHLDDPPRFLFWPVDEAMIFIFPVFLGIMINLALIFLVVAIISCKFWKKVKGSGGRGIIQAILYWHYPRSILDLKYTPDSSIKYYIS